MKTIIMAQFFIVTVIMVFSLHSEENTNTAENLEQRKQRVKEIVRQELAKGTSMRDIHSLLHDLVDQTPEGILYNRVCGQYDRAESQLKEYLRQQCHQLQQEYDQTHRPWRNNDHEWARLEACRKQCSMTVECQQLQKEKDKLWQERKNALSVRNNIYEATIWGQIENIYLLQEDIRLYRAKIREKQEVLRPLKKERDELEEKEEAMLDELKGQLAQ